MTQIAMPSQRETIDGRNGSTHNGATVLASRWGSMSTETGALDHLHSISTLPQACMQLARTLEESLAGDSQHARAGSTDALLDAVLLLNQAARKAVQLEELLSTAQHIIDASRAGTGR